MLTLENHYEWSIKPNGNEEYLIMKKTATAISVISLIFSSMAEIGDKVSFSPTDVNTYRVNALKGDADAMYLYSVCLFSGYVPGKKPDPITGMKFARQAAKKGNKHAYFWVGRGYAEGHGVERSQEKADKFYAHFVLWAKKPEADAMAKCYLGHYYRFTPTDKDLKKAAKYYLESAMKGNLDGQFAIGSCLLNGSGTKKDPKAGIEWLKKSAAAGFPPAMHSLGKCYEEGIGVAVSDKEAIEWYSKAAIQGHEQSFKSLQRLMPQEIFKDEI